MEVPALKGEGRWDWLLPSLVDHRASTEPDLIYMEYPASPSTYNDGLKVITYRKLANAVNGAAAWIEKSLGGRSENHEVLAYVGPTDPRYPIFALAACKAGYALLFPSPRNSVPAHQNLFTLTGCTKLLTPSPELPFIQPVAEETGSTVFHVPTLDELLEQPHPHFSYNKTFDKAKKDPFLILHTSGSTGLPKPVPYSQGFPAAYQYLLKSPPGDDCYVIYDVYDGGRVYSMLPPFHMAGNLINLFSPVFNKTTVIIPPYQGPPNALGLGEALDKTTADIIFTTPLTCRELVDNPTLMDKVSSKVEYFAFAGGACPEEIGNIMTQKFKFWTALGQSEYGSIPAIRQKGEWARDEWNYISINPVWGCEFRPFDGRVFEQWIVRKPEYEHAQTVFKNFPDLQEYCTKDIFAPHPTKPNTWRYRGRLDDIIVFLTGEKTNPNSFEATVSSHPEVSAAIVIGAQRFQAALLIEAKTVLDGPIQRAEFLERIWPVIERANSACPAHARVMRSHVLFTAPKKPMPRAGKGTVQRHQGLSLYKTEIDKLYEDVEKHTPDRSGTSRPIKGFSDEEMVDFVQTIALKVTKWTQLGHQDDFFGLGMDSLQVLQLTRNLKANLDCKDLSPSMIYTNRTVSSLATAIKRLDQSEQASQAEVQKAHEEQIGASLASHIKQLDYKFRRTGRVVLLTGSTGAIGSYLLHELIEASSVTQIYCFNRGSDSASLQARRNEQRKLPTSFPARVTFFEGDISAANFGLPAEDHGKIVREVTDVVHAAWPVNWNLSLESFDPQLAGVVQLVELGLSAPKRPKIHFFSTVAAALELGSKPDVQSIPEATITDPSAPTPTGYGSSKHIAECLLSHASENYGLECSIFRIGQVSGPSEKKAGEGWAKQEWFPSLVISSAALGALPDSIGGQNGVSGTAPTIDWIPIDSLAKVIAELVTTDPPQATTNGHTDAAKSSKLEVYHLMNPQRTTWSALLPTVQKSISSRTGKSLEIVPLEKWVAKVKASSQTMLEGETNGNGKAADGEGLLSKIPAIKLLDFYEGWLEPAPVFGDKALFQTTRAEARSETLRGVGPVTNEQMEAWVDGWMHS